MNYTNFAEGEITIFCGENARTTVNASLKLASAIKKTKRKGNILYVNTVFSTRKIMAAARLQFPSPGTPGEGLGVREGVFFHNAAIGELCHDLNGIKERIESENITCVIINSWEFANRSYIYKERAIFGLKALVAETGVTLLIYSQSPLATAGKIQRGGLGKLAALADDIISLDAEFGLGEEEQPDETEMLHARKINNLTYPRS